MNFTEGDFSLVTEGPKGKRKIIGTQLTVRPDQPPETYNIYLPVTSWNPLPTSLLSVGITYPVQIHRHRDQTISLIKLEDSPLTFVKV